MNIVGLDIETTHLKGNMGHILCAVAWSLGARTPKVWRIDKTEGFGKCASSFTNDKEIVAGIVEYMTEKADIVVTHYGTYFDIPFINTRALNWKMAPLPPIAHIDIWKVARKQLCLTSNRQATVNDLVDADHSKYKPGWEVWRKAQYGDKGALDILTRYCKNDVAGLLENYTALRPLILHHPHWQRSGRGSCVACGSSNLQYRGYRRTKKQRIARIHCQDCGTWSDGERKNV